MFYLINPTSFKIFDAHLHSYGTFMKPSKDIIEYMDRFQVEKALITTTNRRARPTAHLKLADSESKELNEAQKLEKMLEFRKSLAMGGQLDHQDIIDIAKKAPERFYKVFWFNPKIRPEEEDTDYKILEDHFKKGFCGVKIHSGIHSIKIPKDVIKLVSFMQEYDRDFIFYIHSTPKTPFFSGISTRDMAKLAKQFPNLRIIVGHAGFCMEYAIDVGISLKQYKNIFFETSCSVSFAILSLIRTVGYKRLLFGSDAPITSPIQIEIDKILTLPISKEEKQDILYTNTENLLEKIK